MAGKNKTGAKSNPTNQATPARDKVGAAGAGAKAVPPRDDRDDADAEPTQESPSRQRRDAAGGEDSPTNTGNAKIELTATQAVSIVVAIVTGAGGGVMWLSNQFRAVEDKIASLGREVSELKGRMQAMSAAPGDSGAGDSSLDQTVRDGGVLDAPSRSSDADDTRSRVTAVQTAGDASIEESRVLLALHAPPTPESLGLPSWMSNSRELHSRVSVEIVRGGEAIRVALRHGSEVLRFEAACDSGAWQTQEQPWRSTTADDHPPNIVANTSIIVLVKPGTSHPAQHTFGFCATLPPRTESWRCFRLGSGPTFEQVFLPLRREQGERMFEFRSDGDNVILREMPTEATPNSLRPAHVGG